MTISVVPSRLIRFIVLPSVVIHSCQMLISRTSILFGSFGIRAKKLDMAEILSRRISFRRLRVGGVVDSAKFRIDCSISFDVFGTSFDICLLGLRLPFHRNWRKFSNHLIFRTRSARFLFCCLCDTLNIRIVFFTILNSKMCHVSV